MKMSKEGRALVEAFEGCDKPVPGKPGFFKTYHDEVGVLTIGYGHTNLGSVPPHISEGDEWTLAQCDAALDNDMGSFEAHVEKIMAGTPLTQGEFDALVSFDFNTGDLAKSSIPAKIKAGSKAAAMATLLQYNHAGGKVLNGLTRRRNAEKLLFEGDVTAALKLAGAHVESADKNPKAIFTQEHIDMPTEASNDPIPQIIATLESLRKFLPLLTNLPFVPPVVSTAATAGIPIIETILQLIEDAKNKSGVDLFQAIGTHIQVIGAQVQTGATAVAQLPAPAAKEGMPNS